MKTLKTKKNKGGRPKLSKSEQRSKAVLVSFTEEEFAEIEKIANTYYVDFANKRTVAPFLRKTLLNISEPEGTRIKNDNSRIVYELNKIGVNLNQVVRTINTLSLKNPNYQPDDELRTIKNMMFKIVDVLNSK